MEALAKEHQEKILEITRLSALFRSDRIRPGYVYSVFRSGICNAPPIPIEKGVQKGTEPLSSGSVSLLRQKMTRC